MKGSMAPRPGPDTNLVRIWYMCEREPALVLGLHGVGEDLDKTSPTLPQFVILYWEYSVPSFSFSSF